MSRRSFAAFALLALVAAFALTRGLIAAPGYTDVYYHLNAANRLAGGQGLTDPYVWTYIGALDHLPMPSHLYWMPLTSVIAGVSMSLFSAPGDYAVAQLPFTLLFALTACVGFWLGARIGGTARHAWVAGLLTLFSGFYVKFWGEIDTFAPYALVGSLCLILMGVGAGFKPAPTGDTAGAHNRAPLRWEAVVWFAAGVLAALGHLTRADGLLLLIVGVIVIASVGARRTEGSHHVVPLRGVLISLAALALGYLLVMLPYFARNLREIGTPLPLGGTQAIWFAEYNDIFNYPPDSSPATLFAHGIDAFVSGRVEALVNNFGTFVAVEGLVVMTPLMLVGWWRRRRDPLLLPFALYALGLHLAMTFVFPFPGYRGGLLHSAAALIPFWAALGVTGLDDVVDWVARHRRRWKARTAKWVFSGGLVAVAVGLEPLHRAERACDAGDARALHRAEAAPARRRAYLERRSAGTVLLYGYGGRDAAGRAAERAARRGAALRHRLSAAQERPGINPRAAAVDPRRAARLSEAAAVRLGEVVCDPTIDACTTPF